MKLCPYTRKQLNAKDCACIPHTHSMYTTHSHKHTYRNTTVTQHASLPRPLLYLFGMLNWRAAKLCKPGQPGVLRGSAVPMTGHMALAGELTFSYDDEVPGRANYWDPATLKVRLAKPHPKSYKPFTPLFMENAGIGGR